MTAAAWTVGGILILAAGLWPLRSMLQRSMVGRSIAGRSMSHGPGRHHRDEARSLLSQLETALELAANDLPSDTRAAVERYQLLAGAALGGDPDQDDYQRSIQFSRSGLELLGELSGS
jgi:hypothetical protein